MLSSDGCRLSRSLDQNAQAHRDGLRVSDNDLAATQHRAGCLAGHGTHVAQTAGHVQRKDMSSRLTQFLISFFKDLKGWGHATRRHRQASHLSEKHFFVQVRPIHKCLAINVNLHRQNGDVQPFDDLRIQVYGGIGHHPDMSHLLPPIPAIECSDSVVAHPPLTPLPGRHRAPQCAPPVARPRPG
jgi:hypothetical protein